MITLVGDPLADIGVLADPGSITGGVDLDLHLFLDNYATRKTPAIHQWRLKHPRFRLHFTPASSSWLNLAKRWFAELTNLKLHRSAHPSVTELEGDVRKWINEWNKDPGRSLSSLICLARRLYICRIFDGPHWASCLSLETIPATLTPTSGDSILIFLYELGEGLQTSSSLLGFIAFASSSFRAPVGCPLCQNRGNITLLWTPYKESGHKTVTHDVHPMQNGSIHII